MIEAVPEDPALKRDVLARIESAVGTEVIIATNTSSLTIATLAAGVREPRRSVGMHFNPMPASKLIEIVRGPDTGEQAVQGAADLAAAVGKEIITVRGLAGLRHEPPGRRARPGGDPHARRRHGPRG